MYKQNCISSRMVYNYISDVNVLVNNVRGSNNLNEFVNKVRESNGMLRDCDFDDLRDIWNSK